MYLDRPCPDPMKHAPHEFTDCHQSYHRGLKPWRCAGREKDYPFPDDAAALRPGLLAVGVAG
jgi:hypothetical protein